MYLRVPCCYQGGKQRIASLVVERILSEADSEANFYDLCCGSGAISIELLNQGVSPERITMLDSSSWGAFWKKIGSGAFDFLFFDELITRIPTDKKNIQPFMQELSLEPIDNHEAEIYIVLQANSFGGKQIWLENGKWKNAFFRSFWQPTPTSIRRSVANPMQPSPVELQKRVIDLSIAMKGVNVIKDDISSILDTKLYSKDVVYVDPPYKGSTGYGFGFDLRRFIDDFYSINDNFLFVSEGRKISEDAVLLPLNGANGGISGRRKNKHEEWLNLFNVTH